MAKTGRPSKIKEWSEELELLLQDEIAVIALTDKELQEEVNYRLERKGKEGITIDVATFKRWKARDWDSIEQEWKRDLGKHFCALYKKAVSRIKRNLLTSVRTSQEGENQWQAQAWIIERKFKEWNLKKISEVDQTVKGGITINTNANTSSNK